ncbi:MAG: hypothetical protein ACRDP5_24840 [Streptosporangiaceae bacterium]
MAVTARPASSPFLVVGLLLVAVAAALVIMALSAASVDDEIWWGAVALTVFCAGLLPLMTVASRSDGLGLASWRIGPWSLVWGALAFGLATISWLGPQIGSSSAEILPDSILRALSMIGVALTMLTAGYCAGPYRLAVTRARHVTDAINRRFSDEIRGPAVPWTLCGVGLVAQLASAVLTGHLGYVGDVAASVTTAPGYGQYLSIAGECVPLAVMAAAIRAYRTRTVAAWLSLGVLFAVAIAIGALAGGKASFVVAILAVIIPRSVVRGRLPTGAIVAAVLAFLLIVIPFNLAYRASARGAVTLSTGQAVAAAPAIADQVVASDLSPAVLGQSFRYLAQRIRTIDTPAIVMQRTPGEIPFASPAQLLVAPVVGLIPRILWPGKPVLTPGYQISQEYFQLPPQVYTSSAVTPEADLYRHGGWFPLILGMFLLGCGIRILDEVTDLRRSVHGAFLIVLLFPDTVQSGTDCATLLAGIPGMVLLWLAVVTLSFRHRPASASASAS